MFSGRLGATPISRSRQLRAKPRLARSIASTGLSMTQPDRESHNEGVDVGISPRPENSLLMIQGPLLLAWTQRNWGVSENREFVSAKNQPPTKERLELWLRACVSIPAMQNWRFVKLHTHGVCEPNQEVLLGEEMVRFHEGLQERASRDPLFRFHYVTAREMANLALAAEAGGAISFEDGRSFRYLPIE